MVGSSSAGTSGMSPFSLTRTGLSIHLLTFDLQTLDNDYNYDGSNVIVTASTLQAVVSAGVTTVLTFEFYPREPDNIATYTLYV